MDPQNDLPDLVEDLEVNIDELSTALEPLLQAPLHTTASSLPLLDKAKLYVLAAYSIESLLFSTLQASGVNAKEHAIFKELARLKKYFGKIKEVEDRGVKGSAEGRARLDVGAAQRFIKHGLAGNDRYDLERRERAAKEKARAYLKAAQINKKFDDEGNEKAPENTTPKKRGVDEVAVQDEEDEDEEILGGLEEVEPATKKARVSAADPMDIDSAPSPASQVNTTRKGKKKRGRKAKHSAESTEAEDQQEDNSPDQSVAAGSQEVDTPQPKKRGRPPKKDKNKAKQNESNIDTEDPEVDTQPSRHERRVMGRRNGRLSNRRDDPNADEEAVVPTPDRAPKTRSETFNALLDGSLNEKQKKGKASGRGRGRGRGRGK